MSGGLGMRHRDVLGGCVVYRVEMGDVAFATVGNGPPNSGLVQW